MSQNKHWRRGGVFDHGMKYHAKTRPRGWRLRVEQVQARRGAHWNFCRQIELQSHMLLLITKNVRSFVVFAKGRR